MYVSNLIISAIVRGNSHTRVNCTVISYISPSLSHYCATVSVMDLKWVDTSLNLRVSPCSNSRDDYKIIDENMQKGECSGDCAKPEGEVKVSAAADYANLVRELGRLTLENKKLTTVLAAMSEKYSALHNHLMRDLTNKNSEKETTQSRKKRKAHINEFGVSTIGTTTDCSSSEEEPCKRPKEDDSRKVLRVLVRTDPSDTTQYVKDGYHWRKYGQKVTRDNPSPRAYFKCSNAPNCPVKKKVQRSLGDQSILVATYEGEHNHARPDQTELPVGSVFRGKDLGIAHAVSSISTPACPTVLFQPAEMVDERESTFKKELAPEMRRFLVQEMVTSLTKDPNFTAVLAAAISGRILDETGS